MLLLLDTNAYLRLAKRIRPLVGVAFGQKGYVVTVLADVENEVMASSRLRFRYPWFNETDLDAERLAKRVKLSREQGTRLNQTAAFLRDWVLQDVTRFTKGGRQPPGPTDCRVLAFAQVCDAIVVTDDLGMHELATEFSIATWHGPELLAKMRSGKVVTSEQIREIYAALEANGDMTLTWRDARNTTFAKIFGSKSG